MFSTGKRYLRRNAFPVLHQHSVKQCVCNSRCVSMFGVCWRSRYQEDQFSLALQTEPGTNTWNGSCAHLHRVSSLSLLGSLLDSRLRCTQCRNEQRTCEEVFVCLTPLQKLEKTRSTELTVVYTNLRSGGFRRASLPPVLLLWTRPGKETKPRGGSLGHKMSSSGSSSPSSVEFPLSEGREAGETASASRGPNDQEAKVDLPARSNHKFVVARKGQQVCCNFLKGKL